MDGLGSDRGPALPAAVVIDTETTGFGRADRIIEIAAVSLAPGTWETVDEYDTLVNPERDTGPVGVHGITASMVGLAPVFADIVAAVARRVRGKVLVAHNLAFDCRMLRGEFGRHGVRLDPGAGLCTLRMTRLKLVHACREHGIGLGHQHRALADARATAELARRLLRDREAPGTESAQVGEVPHPARQHTMRRGLADADTSPMFRVVSRANYSRCDEAACAYLDALDWALDDAVIDRLEREGLARLAADLGLSGAQQEEAHRSYLDCIVQAAMRDGRVWPAERDVIARIAGQLGLDAPDLADATPADAPVTLRPGMRVCFTGEAIVDGRPAARGELESIAAHRGLVPVGSVTQKGCDLLVAADPASASAKARAARKHGIPVMPVADFVAWRG